MNRKQSANHENHRYPPTVYETRMKPMIDRALSLAGMIILAPLYGVIAVGIYLDDPGPVFFWQKRVGKNKRYFYLHKFRTMKMCTPCDVPTHMLSNPERYITSMGRFLRKSSLDELPQLWDIFRGKMSIVGPRPALWNQKDLIRERDKYDANSVRPGLTGLAQIRGRDELENPQKAAIDGAYVSVLRSGIGPAFRQDITCLAGTVKSVLCQEGVVEGGTGSLRQKGEERDRLEEYGYKKEFHIDKTARKRVLVTGADSYIGGAFASYVRKCYPNIAVHTLDMKSDTWKTYDFTDYDSVFHVAGIAHSDTGKSSRKEKRRYYAVNRDLAVEAAKKSKASGVKQFIFVSSMIIYGEASPYGKERVIDQYTVPAPSNFYGDSKWQGDMGVRRLADEYFKVAVLRLPMVYGKGSKGNYPILSGLAKKLPIFPNVNNRRSMLYIDNLCEFVSLLVLSGSGGIFFPQNAQYSKTSALAAYIAQANHKKICMMKSLRPFIYVASRMPGNFKKVVNKAFGNFVCDQKLSEYKGLEYRVADLKTSIEQTENCPRDSKHRKDEVEFTVITVCRNRENEVRRTIESVLNQTYPNIEYLIIDGASTDATVSIAKEYEDAFKKKGYQYKIFSEPDKGIYDAMNKGIQRAEGEMIGFINAGDWYGAEAVAVAAGEYEREPYDYFYGDIHLIRANGNTIVKHSRADRFPTSRHWNHPTSFVRRELYKELGGFKGKGIHDDFEFFLRARRAGKKFRIVNRALAYFPVGGTSNEKSCKMCKKRIDDRYRCYRENGYSPLYFFECVGIEAAKFVLS